jgi:hypothetical protein
MNEWRRRRKEASNEPLKVKGILLKKQKNLFCYW